MNDSKNAFAPGRLVIHRSGARALAWIARVKSAEPDGIAICLTPSEAAIRVPPGTLMPIANADLIGPSRVAPALDPALPDDMRNGLPDIPVGPFVFAMTSKSGPEAYGIYDQDRARIGAVRVSGGVMLCTDPDGRPVAQEPGFGDAGFRTEAERIRGLAAAAAALSDQSGVPDGT